MDIYEDIAQKTGGYLIREKDDTGSYIRTKGEIASGAYAIPGNISSQFVSGLLYALSLCPGKSTLRVLAPVESAPYIFMTVSVIRAFGKMVTWEKDGEDLLFQIDGTKSLSGGTYTIEGDYSNAAFLDAFGMLSGELSVTGLPEDSLQGDKIYKKYFAQIARGYVEMSLRDCPDLGPVLMVLCALFHGGKLTDCARLEIKESKRGSAMCEELAKCGIKCDYTGDAICIPAGNVKAPNEDFCGHNDHRIVMACAVLASVTGGRITDAEAVKKSYPRFFEQIKELGIEAEYEEMDQ